MDLAYKLERAEQLEPSSEAIRLPTELIERAITRGAEHLASTQRADGSWTGPYGGPMFLLPMYVSSYYIAGRPIAEPRRQGMIDYLRNVQLRDGNVQLRDGSVGLHDEAEEGSIFTSTLAYVALRLLGLSEDDPDVARMRRWIHANGGALGCAPWGKMTLTLLNLHPYEGMYPLLPELWELPEQLPIHPGRLWCHCRQVYLPMAYLYGEKAQAPLDPLLSQLRDEIYGRPYASIDFAKHRDDLAPVDRFEPVKLPMKVVNRVLGVFERFHPPALRKRIQSKLLDHIRYEDQVTGFVRIGPVNAVLNTLVHHFASPGSETVEKSFEELDRYIYPDRGGLMMNGYNSTALWDTAFATQALLASPDVDRHQQTLDRAHDYIRDNQVLEDVPERGHYHRHASRGGWPFSDRKHGWPITDCTAEGLKCALSLEGEVEKPVPEALLEAAMELLFTWQNPRAAGPLTSCAGRAPGSSSSIRRRSFRASWWTIPTWSAHRRRFRRSRRCSFAFHVTARASRRRSRAASVTCAASSDQTAASKAAGASVLPTAPGLACGACAPPAPAAPIRRFSAPVATCSITKTKMVVGASTTAAVPSAVTCRPQATRSTPRGP
jgi:squalene/oxidosqualene cyclase-like protein